MFWTFGGQPVCDLWEAERQLSDLGFPLPDRANVVMIPGGEPCARGWLLMTRGALDRLDLDTTHDLTLTDDAGRSLTLYDWLPLSADDLFSGETDDAGSLYLLAIADARYRLHNEHYSANVTRQYNVRAHCYRSHPTEPKWVYADTEMDATHVWTWSAMMNDLWGALGGKLGTFPGLPYAPNGSPEDVIFMGAPAWPAFCKLLERLDCTVQVDLSKKSGHRYTIVQMGIADNAAEAALAKAAAANRVLGNSECIESIRGKQAAKSVVLFRMLQEFCGNEETVERGPGASTVVGAQWQGMNRDFQFLTTDVGDLVGTPVFQVRGSDGGGEDLFQPIWDELPAMGECAFGDYPHLDSISLLEARAAERSAHYYLAKSAVSTARIHQRISGVLNIAPGAKLRGVVYRQGLDGDTVTEVFGSPHAPQPVGDDGQWVSPDDPAFGLAARPYRLAPTWPVYPIRMHFISIRDDVIDSVSHMWPASILRYCQYHDEVLAGVDFDPLVSFLFHTGITEEVWAQPINLTAERGKTYTPQAPIKFDVKFGFLIGFAHGKPVFGYDYWPEVVPLLQ